MRYFLKKPRYLLSGQIMVDGGGQTMVDRALFPKKSEYFQHVKGSLGGRIFKL